ncbi:DUF2065 domain-containing protein [Magnetofaba australis]|uniref:DUF2065 domain-containing protein n=1 Tax=Magnetofaba australis IT-1 TaxID=1434232 RepID=A0A1Y2K4S0_9PROT|nr:DUF2065 domain-containing protein [Magnetofaba australis]OSM04398.1 hypothetical protein MAIT1_04306 [Magnetofaba australis IT-1]
MDEFWTALGQALGLLMIIEGAPYFLSPNRMRGWVMKMAEQPDGVLRQTGFVLMLLGLGVVWLARG